jgi:hypothetical protein
MHRLPVVLAASLLCASAACAFEIPSRKAGLWELKMDLGNRAIPAQVTRQCIDAATDTLMLSNFGGTPQRTCKKQTSTRTSGEIVIDSVCTIAGGTTTTHTVISGDLSSAYTMRSNSKREGGPAIPGRPARGETHITIQAKWLGPCGPGQRPGDIILSNGTKINILDLHNRGGMRPPPR